MIIDLYNIYYTTVYYYNYVYISLFITDKLKTDSIVTNLWNLNFLMSILITIIIYRSLWNKLEIQPVPRIKNELTTLFEKNKKILIITQFSNGIYEVL